MAIFFTADHHFGHRAVIGYSNRPFQSAEEMDEVLIKNWNRTVGPNDTVYHLGDLSLRRPELTKGLLKKLNGKIFLIRGNHEKSSEDTLCADRFEWIKDYYFLKMPFGISIALFHYALRVWDRKHHGSWHLHGHSHGKLKPEPGWFSLDVGVDCWGYSPVPMSTIKAEMVGRGWKPKPKISGAKRRLETAFGHSDNDPAKVLEEVKIRQNSDSEEAKD